MRNLHRPYCAVWEITLECNLKCLHCGSNAGKKRKNELTTHEAIKLCGDLKTIGTDKVSLIGGEVFLRSDWDIIARELIKLGIGLVIITNGFYFDKNILNKIVSLRPEGIGISIDASLPPVHDKIRGRKGSFERALSALRMTRDAGIMCTVITSVSKQNFNYLHGLKDLILREKIGWQIQICNCNNINFSANDMLSEDEFYQLGEFVKKLRDDFDKYGINVAGSDDLGYFSSRLRNDAVIGRWQGCQAGMRILGIQSNGDIKPCLSLPDKFIVGNIRERSLVDLWHDDDAFALNRKFKKEYLQGFCAQCPHGEVCRGGCSDIAHSLTGSPYNDPFCFYKIEKERGIALSEEEIKAQTTNYIR